MRQLTGVYRILCLVNGKSYVGASRESIERRVSIHLKGKGNSELREDIRRFGVESFRVDVLEELSPKEDIEIRERYWVEVFNSNSKDSGYNRTSGGETVGGWHFRDSDSHGRTGKELSDDTKEKIRNKQKGSTHNMSEEGLENIRKFHRTEEYKEKQSRSHIGKICSQETRRRISESKKGNRSTRGYKWVNNGVINRRIIESELVRFLEDNPDFHLGRKRFRDYRKHN